MSITFALLIPMSLFYRFRCLISPKLQRHENVQTIATACCVLHNLLIDMDPRGAQALADVEDPVNHELRPGAWRRELEMIDLNKYWHIYKLLIITWMFD